MRIRRITISATFAAGLAALPLSTAKAQYHPHQQQPTGSAPAARIRPRSRPGESRKRSRWRAPRSGSARQDRAASGPACLVVSAAVLMPFLPLIFQQWPKDRRSAAEAASSGRPSTPRASGTAPWRSSYQPWVGRYGGLSSRVLLDAEASPNVWVVRKGGHITAGFGAEGISRIAHGASRRSRSAVALETKAFGIIRARGGRVRSGLAAGGNRIRTLGPARNRRSSELVGLRAETNVARLNGIRTMLSPAAGRANL